MEEERAGALVLSERGLPMSEAQLPSSALLTATAVSFSKTSLRLPIGACQAIVVFCAQYILKCPCVFLIHFIVDNSTAVFSRKVKSICYKCKA